MFLFLLFFFSFCRFYCLVIPHSSLVAAKAPKPAPGYNELRLSSPDDATTQIFTSFMGAGGSGGALEQQTALLTQQSISDLFLASLAVRLMGACLFFLGVQFITGDILGTCFFLINHRSLSFSSPPISFAEQRRDSDYTRGVQHVRPRASRGVSGRIVFSFHFVFFVLFFFFY